MNIVIGLVGEIGAGKETFTKLLREIAADKTISLIRFSDILIETLNLWGISLTRENLQKLAVAMDRVYGKGTLTNAVRLRLEKDPAEIKILDGVRWQTDAAMVRGLPNSFLVYVTARIQLRFNRAKLRKAKVGEGEMTFEEFIKANRAETEKYIPEIGKNAQFVMENNGTLEDLKRQISNFYHNFLLKKIS